MKTKGENSYKVLPLSLIKDHMEFLRILRKAVVAMNLLKKCVTFNRDIFVKTSLLHVKVGRKSYTKGLQIQKVGLTLRDRGNIILDKW